nr:hypothetical protein RF28184 [Allium cepa]
MAADSNMGFHQGIRPSLSQSRHMLSFQSENSGNSSLNVNPRMAGAVNMANSSGSIGVSNGAYFQRSPGFVNNDVGSIGQSGSSSSNLRVDPLVGIQQKSDLTPEWTLEEQHILKQGLIKHAGEHSTMKYIKIASTLKQKTVRDVALRCRWLAENGKRRKLEAYYAVKNQYNKKTFDSSSNMNRQVANLGISVPSSQTMHQGNQYDTFAFQVPPLDVATQQLMDENSRVLNQILNNLAAYKIQENVDLFCHASNNISIIQTNMSNTPGIMSQMPPLPELAKEDFLNVLLSSQNQAFMFNDPGMLLDQQTLHKDLL